MHLEQEISELLARATPEMQWQTSRASGAGGQHVNKVETRVTLLWDLMTSQVLTPEQVELIQTRLGTYINKEGKLMLSCQASRSQARNKELTMVKLRDLLFKALQKKKTRKPTQPTAASIRRRRNQKARRSKVKQLRNKPRLDD